MKLRIVVLLAFVTAIATAQDGASLSVVPITGIPDGSVVISYDVLMTEAANRLVVHAKDPSGTVVFYLFDYVDGTLRGRVAADAAIPVRFRDPAVAVAQHAEIAGLAESDRYRAVGQTFSPVPNEQFVTAVPLPERRFTDVTGSLHAELPPDDAALSIEYVIADVSGNVISRCMLEPNLVRISERMTTISAGWILAQGRPHLLVGLAVDRGADPWPTFYRLYSPSMELVAQTPPVIMADPNRAPQPVDADLDGDGTQELIVFSSSGTGPPIAVLKPGPSADSGSRVLALNDCNDRMNGADVVMLQTRLENLGYSVGRYGIDGWYGPDTRAAVVAFQRDSNLLVTGVVDEVSWNLLGIR